MHLLAPLVALQVTGVPCGLLGRGGQLVPRVQMTCPLAFFHESVLLGELLMRDCGSADLVAQDCH